MFDNDLRSAPDAAVVEAIADHARAEAAASSRRLAAVTELVRRRCGSDDRDLWACDSWDAAAAEVSAALGITHGRASGEMRMGVSLARRLPRVAELLAEGAVSYRVAAAIAWRTDLVEDSEALAAIESALIGQLGSWGPLSDYKLDQVIDMWIDRFDPGALRRTRAAARSRGVEFGSRDEASGTSSLWGRLFSTDARILDRRLTQMAQEVCEGDPRTLAQRRADALGALAAGAERLCFRCGAPACQSDLGAAAASVVIHVLTDAAALAETPDPNISGRANHEPYILGTSLAEYLRGGPEPEPTGAPAMSSTASTSPILGGGMVPAPLLAELIHSGAKIRPLRRPPATAESGYRPSAALAEFIRMRDMTCRFPNCTVPAEFCDIDHSVPWPFGPTHPSNLNCKCRKHHLLKTFWAGATGWSEEQLADGTIRFTSPAGRTYTTAPGSRLFFPDWDTGTGPVQVRAPEAPTPGRGLQMPLRSRSRAAERACRVKRERALNDARVAERNMPPPF